jgi:hypothetical protein
MRLIKHRVRGFETCSGSSYFISFLYYCVKIEDIGYSVS